MTEKELEKLFKTKLGAANYEYNPAAWQAMENILDQKAPRGGGYFWRAAAAIVAFGALLASINLWQTDQPANQQLQQAVPVAAPTPENLLPTVPVSLDAADEPAPETSEKLAGTDPSAGINNDAGSDQDAAPAADEAAPLYAVADDEPQGPAGSIDRPEDMERPNVLTNSRASAGLTQLRAKSLNNTYHLAIAEVRPAPFVPNVLRRSGRHGFYLKGGSILNEAYNTGDMGIGFHLGAEYQFNFAPGFDLSAGINFSRINRVGIHQQFDSTFYHFASERVETEITGRQLDYLEMPVSLQWRFHPRHQVGVGGYLSLLMRVSESMEKRHYAQGEELSVEEHEQDGRLSPYENYDLGLAFNYFYMVSEQLEVGLEVRRGLVDITRDTESVYTQNHQNLNTRLSLRYRIL